MAHDFRELTDYLRSVGTERVPHSEGYFLAHLIGVYRDLKEWGCEEHVVLALMQGSAREIRRELLEDLVLCAEEALPSRDGKTTI